MYKGSCLCGKVQYQINAFIGDFYFCHCSQCRKETGTAFASNAFVHAKDFTVTQGEELIKNYQNGKSRRTFCNACGTHIYALPLANPDILRLRMGTVDTPLNQVIQPTAHLFVDSKIDWTPLCGNLPQYPQRP